jgi:hypothetical protein
MLYTSKYSSYSVHNSHLPGPSSQLFLSQKHVQSVPLTHLQLLHPASEKILSHCSKRSISKYVLCWNSFNHLNSKVMSDNNRVSSHHAFSGSTMLSVCHRNVKNEEQLFPHKISEKCSLAIIIYAPRRI